LQELGRASTGGKRKADPKKDAKKPAKVKASSKEK